MTSSVSCTGRTGNAHVIAASVDRHARVHVSRDRARRADRLDPRAGEPAGTAPGMGLVALELAIRTPRRRDRALDLLRGYLLCVILVDHVHWFPSLFEPLTGRGQLWASAAESFILISGFLVGKLRGAEVRRGEFRAAAGKIFGRAATLAGWCAGVTLVLTLVSRATGYLPQGPGAIDPGPFPLTVLHAVTLRYTYGDHDVLALYAILLAFAPLPLYLMSRGWSHVVLAASAALWALVLILPGESTWAPRSAFSEPSWQLLFYGAMVAGYHAHRLPALTPRAHARLLAVLVPVFAVTFAASWIHLGDRTPLEIRLFHRVEVGPGRLVVAVVWLVTFYELANRYGAALARTVGRILEPLGRASLYVFIVQAFVTFPFYAGEDAGFVAATLADVLIIGVLWFMVRYRVLFSVIPR